MFFMFECVVQQRRIALSVFTFFFGGSISRCFPKPKTVGGQSGSSFKRNGKGQQNERCSLKWPPASQKLHQTTHADRWPPPACISVNRSCIRGMHAGFSKNMAKHPLHILSYLLYTQSKHRLFSRVDFSAGSISQPVLRLFSRIDSAAACTTFQPGFTTFQPGFITFQPTCSQKIYYFNNCLTII